MALNEVAAEKMSLQQKMDQQRQVVERNMAEAESLKRRIETTKSHHQQQMGTLRGKYEKLHQQLKQYHETLRCAMNGHKTQQYGGDDVENRPANLTV